MIDRVLRGLNASVASAPRPAMDQVRDEAVVDGELSEIVRGAGAAENENGLSFGERRTGC